MVRRGGRDMRLRPKTARRCAWTALAGASGLLFAGVAAAEPGDTSLNMFSRVDVAVSGRISARCELAGGGDVDFGELSGGEMVSARMSLGCNVPFDLSFQSARGGLTHTTRPMGEGPFAGALPYTLNVRVPVLKPAPGTVSGRYESRQLLSAKTLSSGEGIAAGDARIEIRTHDLEGAGLLAGRYTETLTVTVTPRV